MKWFTMKNVWLLGWTSNLAALLMWMTPAIYLAPDVIRVMVLHGVVATYSYWQWEVERRK